MKRIPTRQILLLVVVLGLAVFNVVRYQRTKKLASPAPVADAPATGVWGAFDKAAAQRDAPDAQFQPALATLRGEMAAMPDPNLLVNANILRDVHGCLIWLQFYRQSAGAVHPDVAWHTRSQKHIDGCVREHRDVSE